MKLSFPRRLAALGLTACVLFPGRLWACATCFGKSDDAMARGMNMGILSLLLVVGFVLSCFAAFAIFLMRRAAQFSGANALSAAQTDPATEGAEAQELTQQPHSS